jgi:hypothetical protein
MSRALSFGLIFGVMQDSLAATVVKHLSPMAATQLIAARVTSETKADFHALAERQQLTESVLLKRMIDLTLQSVSAAGGKTLEPVDRVARGTRLCIRLRSEDQLLLRERASARQMAAATYVSVLIRAHLRALPPLPKDELNALKRSVAELGAIGRNLNQIARAANQGGRVSGPGREDLRAMLKVCEGLRDHVKALIKANEASWENGHARAGGSAEKGDLR